MPRHSHDMSHENAMTEIALALAMGFFSLMVLTLISMGAGENKAAKKDVLVLAPMAQSGATGATDIEQSDLILIFDGERFVDTNMTEIDPTIAIKSRPDPAGRVVLALDPELSLESVIKARGLVQAENLVVTSLDKQWQKALKDYGRVQ